VSPFGRGVCGCRRAAPGGARRPYVRWPEDQTCYPLHERGPCLSNHTLQFDRKSSLLVCVPSLCPSGLVLHNDGRCYQLDSQGPCGKGFVLTLGDDDAYGYGSAGQVFTDPTCKPTTTKVMNYAYPQ